MEYKELSQLFYADASNERDANLKREHAFRFNASSTFRLGFDTPQGELFIAMPREMSIMTELVMRSEHRIYNRLAGMPVAASNAVLRGFVLDEVVSNNAIENIYSTRRQVKEALEVTAGAPSGAKRFRELAVLYLGIIDNSVAMPSCPEDIRRIYDEVTCGEISAGDLPDGELFRAQGVGVVQGGYRVVHNGIEPESAIIHAIQQMLHVAVSREIPALHRGLAAHYMFEYIHPFYDGNGRTGRYLLSLMLSDALSPATALSLSRVISQNRDAYYRAFKTAEKPLNKGELTFFIYTMLEFIREAQEELDLGLREKVNLLDALDEVMAKAAEQESLKDQEAKVVRALLEHEAFGLCSDAPLGELADRLGLGVQMTRRHIAALEDRDLIKRRRPRNPITFALTEQFLARYGLEYVRSDD